MQLEQVALAPDTERRRDIYSSPGRSGSEGGLVASRRSKRKLYSEQSRIPSPRRETSAEENEKKVRNTHPGAGFVACPFSCRFPLFYSTGN